MFGDRFYFIRRFLNPHKAKNSTNEFELLGVVWAVEHYKNYLCGSKFVIITDHQAVSSAFSCNHGNKTCHSRLIRWVDRLSPFVFSRKHLAGKEMGFRDLILKNPNGKPNTPSKYDQNFVVATISKNNLIINSSCVQFIAEFTLLSNWTKFGKFL